MMVRLAVAHPLNDPEDATRLLDDPGTWLAAPAATFGPSTWRVDLHAGPIHRRVAMYVGGVWQHGTSAWRPVRWEPVEDGTEVVPMESLLPVFVGEIGVVHGTDGPAEVRLRGAYDPPGRFAGAVADHAGLHRVAEATAHHLLEAIADRMHQQPASIGANGPATGAPRP